MALKQWVTARYGRVGARVVSILSATADIAKSLFDIKEGDGALMRGVKTSGFAIRRALYVYLDKLLAGGAMAIVVVAKELSYPFLVAAALMWVYNFVVSGAFLVWYAKTGQDLTLGSDFRRAADTAREKSRLAGYFVMANTIVFAIFWTGPEQVLIFFRKEIRTHARAVGLLLILAAIQALIWTAIYGFGYEVLKVWLKAAGF